MNYDEAKLYLEHTGYDDFNLEEHQINNRLEAIKTILKENQQLKIQISAREEEYKKLEKLVDTILNFEFFKSECPLNLGFEKDTNEDKAQDVFNEDGYCENTCNDDYKKCWLKYFKRLKELE